MTVHIASDDAFARCIWEIRPTDPTAFEREADPPEATRLRILVDDGRGEYALPWAYQLRDGDFYAASTGLGLDDGIAVRGWMLWEGGR